MNLTIGFCEIALVTSLFFFKESWWIGVILLTIAIIGKIISFALKWSNEQEKTKTIKSANDALAKSLSGILESSKQKKDKKPDTLNSKPKNKAGIPDFIFENYIDKKDKQD